MARRIVYIWLLLALYLSALILPPRPATAADPAPGDACAAGENAINTFQWNPTGDNGTPAAAGVTNAIFCIGNVRKSIMTLQAATGNVGIGTTTPGATLTVNGSIAVLPSAVSLTADNTAIDVTGKSFIQFTSNNATPTNRTFCFKGGVTGQRVVAELTNVNGAEFFDGASPCAASQSNNLVSTISFAFPGSTMEVLFDGTDWVQLGTP